MSTNESTSTLPTIPANSGAASKSASAGIPSNPSIAPQTGAHSSVTGTPALPPNATAVETEIAELMGKIEELKQQKLQQEGEEEAKRREELRAKIASLVPMFQSEGARTLFDVIAIIRKELSGTASGRGRKDKERIMDAIRNGATFEDVSKHFGLSRSRYFKFKNELGMTKEYKRGPKSAAVSSLAVLPKSGRGRKSGLRG